MDVTFVSDQNGRRKKIGKGGYSKVYEGILKENSRSRPCAIKVFLEDRVSPLKIKEEISVWNNLSHPNIVSLLGCLEENPTLPSLVLEKMDESYSLFLSERPMGRDETYHIKVNILHQVARGITYIHFRGLTHGDLTANNVLLSHNRQLSVIAKISDFGASRMVSPKQLTSTVSPGTDFYMPPEIFENPPSSSTKTDSFSFGILIIHSLIHKLPRPLPATYTKDQSRHILAIRTEYERWEHHLEQVDTAKEKKLLPLIKRCLQNIADSRPTTAEILKDIEVHQESHKNYSESSVSDIPQYGITPAASKRFRQNGSTVIYKPQINIYNADFTNSTIQGSILNVGNSTTSTKASSSNLETNICNTKIMQSNLQGSTVNVGTAASNPSDNPQSSNEITNIPRIQKQEKVSKLQKIASKASAVNSRADHTCYYEFEESPNCKLAVVKVNLKQITLETGAYICYNRKTKMFTITGDNKEIASQGKEKLLELIQAVCERPRIDRSPFVMKLPLPPGTPRGLLYGRNHLNFVKLAESTNMCQFDINNRENAIRVFGRSRKHCETGYREAKILISAVTKNISSESTKMLTFLSGVDDNDKVTLVKMPNPGSYYALQLITKKDYKPSYSSQISKLLYYNLMKEKVEKSLSDLLTINSTPMELRILVKFGKVLWHLPKVNSSLRLPVRCLDRNCCVTLKQFLFKDARTHYQPEPKHQFSSGAAVNCVKLLDSTLPRLGQSTVITVQVIVMENVLDKEILDAINVVLIKDGDKYQVADVVPTSKKEIILDAVCLEGNFDFRLKLSFSTKEDLKSISHDSVKQKFWDIGEKIASDIVENESGDISITPRQKEYAVVFVARRNRQVFQYDFQETSYLLTYSESDVCDDSLQTNGTLQQRRITLKLKRDRGIMIHDSQMILDFATLYNPDMSPTEVFSWFGCSPPVNCTLRAKTPTTLSILRGLDKLVAACLHISINKI